MYERFYTGLNSFFIKTVSVGFVSKSTAFISWSVFQDFTDFWLKIVKTIGKNQKRQFYA